MVLPALAALHQQHCYYVKKPHALQTHWSIPQINRHSYYIRKVVENKNSLGVREEAVGSLI